MSENLKLGQIITTPQERDAIHIAVVPQVASHRLEPGAHVAVPGENGGFPVGVVDPFLRHPVEQGQSFWLFLYPGSITSLRHDWTHPAFATPGRVALPANVSASEKWIREFAESVSLDYETVMGGATQWVYDKANGGWGDYLCFGGLLEGEVVPDEFWPHYEAVKGVAVPDEHRGSFFSCSC